MALAVVDEAGWGLVLPLLLVADGGDGEEVGGEGEGRFESDVGLLVVRLGDEEAAALLLLAFHVECTDLVDMEAVERLEDAFDLDLGGGGDGSE